MNRTKFSIFLAAGAASFFLNAQLLAAPTKRALLIGNSAYGGDLDLRNPVNDATDVAESLKDVGFTVNLRTNLDLAGMEDALVEFRRSLQEGDVALFYYAGHGLEVEGQNYLVPIGARIREAFEVKRQAMDVAATLDAMKDSGAKLNVLVLDCCRDNPLRRSWAGRSAGGNRGLASINAPEGTLIAYSTSPGAVAADGATDSRNSPYSAALVQALRARSPQGLELKDVFFNASREVKKATGQTPWISLEASLEDYFLLAANSEYEVTNPSAMPPDAAAPTQLPPAPATPTVAVPPQAPPLGLQEIFDGTDYDLYNASSKVWIIKQAQQKLKNAGHYAGSVDGSTGFATQRAIISWQRERGLPLSGQLDARTLASLILAGVAEQAEPASKPSQNGTAKPKSASKPKPSTPRPARPQNDDSSFRNIANQFENR